MWRNPLSIANHWVAILDVLPTNKKVRRNSSGGKLPLMVAATVFLLQLVVFSPAWFAGYSQAVDALVDTEQASLESRFLASDLRGIILRTDSLLSGALTGLLVADLKGNVLFRRGDTLGVENVGSTLSSSGSIRSRQVTLSTKDKQLDSVIFVNISAASKAAVWQAIFIVAASLIVSLVLTLLTKLCLTKHYHAPLRALKMALRNSRENNEGGTPAPLPMNFNQRLTPIAQEFNGLIEAQKHSDRQIKVKQQYLEFAAHHDPLTHLPNRLMFENALKQTVSESVTDSLPFAVFLVDMDNFKFFNDQYGHLIGDKMVTEIGNRLRTMIRDFDLVARLDGDEFVVIQKDVADKKIVEEIAQRIMTEASAPYEYRGFTLKTAVSVGISCFPANVQKNTAQNLLGEEIVNNAAVALQEAKSNGKNQYQMFNERMRNRLTARIRLEQDLKIALQEGQFEVFYQPKINIHTRECTGSEALVRWRHPVNGFVAPEAFVPVAEETGMIVELGEWILRTACKKTKELQLKGYSGLNVAVNISAVQFAAGNLLNMVRSSLEESKLGVDSLELEITESAVMDDPEDVIKSLHELNQFGLQLAIDDFGTGYSSLAYLKRFPVDTLKIDRAFITDISSDYDDVAIVEAVLGLAKHFKMKVVAEGVEDEEQLSFLKSQGCDIAQGFFISKPLSEVQFAQWLARWPYGVKKPNSKTTKAAVNKVVKKTGT